MITEKIMESLSGLVPSEAREKVASAISSIMEDVQKEYETAYNDKYQEAYDELVKENKLNVERAHKGYEEAYEVIADLRNRLEVQKEEFNQTLEEEYEEAYKMLLDERAKNEELETRLYEEYDARLKDIKEFMVDKIDEFLNLQGEKFYEMAKNEVLNDPCLAEHKVAFDKVVNVVSNYVNDEDFMFHTSSKVSNLNEQLEKSTKEKRLLEAKIMRLESDMTKLNEVTRETQKLLEEQMLTEEKEWVKKSRNAEGRGDVAEESRKVVLLGENTSDKATAKSEPTKKTLVQEQWTKLAGI